MRHSLFNSGSSSSMSVSKSSSIELNSQRHSIDSTSSTESTTNQSDNQSIPHRHSADSLFTAPISIAVSESLANKKVKQRRKMLINKRAELEKKVLCYFHEEAEALSLKNPTCITEIYTTITLDNNQNVNVELLSSWLTKHFQTQNIPEDLIEDIQGLLELNSDIRDADVLIKEVQEQQQQRTFLSM